jgi:hypothetical protein
MNMTISAKLMSSKDTPVSMECTKENIILWSGKFSRLDKQHAVHNEVYASDGIYHAVLSKICKTHDI